MYRSTTPCFMRTGTCASRIQLFTEDVRRTVLNERETRQMDARVKCIEVPFTVPEEDVLHGVKPCARCGAELYLEGKPLQETLHFV